MPVNPLPPTVFGRCLLPFWTAVLPAVALLPAVAWSLASTVLAAAPVQAADLTVLSGNGAKAAVTELAAQFERATGHKVSLHFEVNPAVRKRIEAGDAFDVAVLNPPVLDALIAQGKVAGSTRVVFGRTGQHSGAGGVWR